MWEERMPKHDEGNAHRAPTVSISTAILADKRRFLNVGGQ
jgi:hypothetical protein